MWPASSSSPRATSASERLGRLLSAERSQPADQRPHERVARADQKLGAALVLVAFPADAQKRIQHQPVREVRAALRNR